MSNFNITELSTDRRTDRWTNGQTNWNVGTYVTKSGGQGDVSCKVWWLFSLVVDKNTNFDINVELRHNRTVNRRTDRRTNEQTNGKAGTYVAKSGGQGDVSCKVWRLFSLVVDKNTNFDINVELRHKCWRTDERTDEQKSGCLCRKVRRSGRCFTQGLMVV